MEGGREEEIDSALLDVRGVGSSDRERASPFDGPAGEAVCAAAAPEQRALTIDECLDLVGFGRFQLRLQAISGLGYMADTAELLFVTFLLPRFAELWPELSRAQLSLVPALSAAGTLVSAPLWGIASDMYGRRGVFLGSMSLMAAAGLASAAAPGFWPFVCTRVLVGAGLGGALAVDFVVFVEYVPAAQRGVSTMLLTMWGVAGVLYVGLCAYLLLPGVGWRVYTASAALPSCVLLLLRLWVPESPRYLLLRGREAEAIHVLRKVARENGRALALPAQLRLAAASAADSGGLRATLRQLGKPPLRRRLCTLGVVWLGLSCAYAGFTFWLPALLQAKDIRGLGVYETYLTMTLAEVPGLLLATLLIDRLGRRAVLASTLLGCALAFAAFSQARSHAQIVLCSSASYFCVVGAWATLYTLTPESFPTAVRATASGATRLCACVGTMLAAPLGSALLEVSDAAPLVAYACALGVCALAALSLPAETSLKPLCETEAEAEAEAKASDRRGEASDSELPAALPAGDAWSAHGELPAGASARAS